MAWPASRRVWTGQGKTAVPPKRPRCHTWHATGGRATRTGVGRRAVQFRPVRRLFSQDRSSANFGRSKPGHAGGTGQGTGTGSGTGFVPVGSGTLLDAPFFM